jgi:competence protein ComFC
MDNLLDLIFPKTCTVCCRKGVYLCNRCRKLFKRNLPECYICRKIKSDYKTHDNCRKNNVKSLNHLFVAWEYNSLTSSLLKKYKYRYVYDISETLSRFLIESIEKSSFSKNLKETLLLTMPIPNNRLKERGFNQTLSLTENLAKALNLDFENDFLRRRNTYDHQSLKDKNERKGIEKGNFFLKRGVNLTRYKSITIVDDVITTGITLESTSHLLREEYGKNLVINGLCMFRGRPYYL